MNAKKKLFHSRPLFYAFLALMFAVATSKFIFDGNLHYILFDVVILLVFLVYCLWAKSYKTLAVMLAVFAFGLGWYFVGMSTFEGKTFYDCSSADSSFEKDGNISYLIDGKNYKRRCLD